MLGQQEIQSQDNTTKTLIAILICVVIASWTTMTWCSYRTYQGAPPIPEQFISASRQNVMSSEDIIAGKAGFQKAGLMDYGSLYGMGSYFGVDYTAQFLVELGQGVMEQLSQKHFGKSADMLNQSENYSIQSEMQTMLHDIKLQKGTVILPDVVARAISNLRTQIATDLLENDPKRGWTKAYSLNSDEALKTADFLIYSSITTVANRPNSDASWTNNWPHEPSVGNKPTTSTFIWTWVSLTILFFAIGVVVVVFKLFIESEDDKKSTDSKLTEFSKPTPSQYATGKYFIMVALLLLVQILVGILLAHAYAERESFYGFDLASILPFSFLRSVHLQSPIAWIGLSWIGAALFLAPIIGAKEPKAQKF